MNRQDALASFPPLTLGFLAALLVTVGCPARAEPTETMIRLVDEQGKPVVGAHVGLFAIHGDDPRITLPSDASGWKYGEHALSDASGEAVLRVEPHRFQYLCLFARDDVRKLSAVVDVQRNARGGPITATIRPECRVTGRLTCRELEARHSDIGWTNVILWVGSKKALRSIPENGTFQFVVPPGTYRIEAYGTRMHFAHKPFTVEPGQRVLALEPIDLPATRLALLEGQPAPELKGVVAWKNSKPVALSELRGKCVLLEFWGYWCGPCVYRMPELFALHDRYAKDGLVIIGVHVDTGIEDDPVNTVAKLDRKLVEIRRNLWKGRDLPFPVALVAAERTAFGPGVEEKARTEAAAEYGVVFYPTQVLIDRHGKVVGKLVPGETAKDVLEKALRARD